MPVPSCLSGDLLIVLLGHPVLLVLLVVSELGVVGIVLLAFAVELVAAATPVVVKLAAVVAIVSEEVAVDVDK